MSIVLSRPCTAFQGTRLIASGAVGEVAPTVAAILAESPDAALLVFDDATGAVIDLDLRGTAAEILARLDVGAKADPGGDTPSPGRGRPKLGVVAREVTLLPRHWEWLSAQPGGASNALRRLVEKARRDDAGQGQARTAKEAAYRFMSAMAGDFAGFEEASRALFADDDLRFARHVADWPADIRAYTGKLMRSPVPEAPAATVGATAAPARGTREN